MNSNKSVPEPMLLTLWQAESQKPDFYPRLPEVTWGGFISHTTEVKLHKISFQIVLFPQLNLHSSILPLLYPASENLNVRAPRNETKAWPLGVLISAPALHRRTFQSHSCHVEQSDMCRKAVLEGSYLLQRKGDVFIGAKHGSGNLSRDFLPLLY